MVRGTLKGSDSGMSASTLTPVCLPVIGPVPKFWENSDTRDYKGSPGRTLLEKGKGRGQTLKGLRLRKRLD